MTEAARRLERLAARVVDGEPVDWQAAERDCANEQERRLVANLRIVTDVNRQLAVSDPGDLSSAPTRLYPIGVEAPDSPALPEDPALPPGARWGPLQILAKVGQGGFGQVYRARDARLDRIVALKLLRLREPSHEERALADGRAMARVRHPNVVTVHGAERIDDRVGIWMDYIDGQTLDEVIAHLGPLGVRDAAGIGIDLCGALAAVHKAGLVHSDIKAQNVMKEKGGRVVLMDFGAARQIGPGTGRGDARVSGTPFYMPPEVFTGQPMTVSGDIYSLGVLLYHLVTRSFPVTAETLGALRRAHARGDVTLLRDARPDLSGGFVRVIEKALAREPADRFATMGQMQQALEGAIQGEPPRAVVPSPEPMIVPRRAAAWRPAALRPAFVALAAGLLLVAAGALWLGRHPNEGAIPANQASIDGAAGTTNPSSADALPRDAASANPPLPGSYSISAALYRSGIEGRERLVPGARVGVGDKIHLDIEASDALHVYVLNHDLEGHTFTLFPRPDCDLKNPLAPGRHRLPGRRITDGTPLDWQVDTVGGREQILIVASRTPLDFVEGAIARMPAGRQYAELPPDAALRLRGMGSVVPRPSEEPPPDAARLFEDIKRLADTGERATGIWIRQIDLENPQAP